MHGAVITDLCMHFESKIENENELESEDETSVVNDCHDICASLLGCAGFIPSDNRKDLQSQLSDRLKEYRKMSRNDRSKINVVPYLAVFCSWGMQEEVANSLSTSIDSAFTNEDAMESSPGSTSPDMMQQELPQTSPVDLVDDGLGDSKSLAEPRISVPDLVDSDKELKGLADDGEIPKKDKTETKITVKGKRMLAF